MVLVVASVWTTYVGVLQDKIGLVIGKGGDTIKSINQVSNDYLFTCLFEGSGVLRNWKGL